MKRLPLLLLLLPILTSCPENKPGNGEEPPHWAEMKTSFSWKEFYAALKNLSRIQHKLYYDPSTMSIAHYCPLTKEEREILSSFNTKFFPPAREYTTHTFEEVAEKEGKLGKRLEDSVGIRNGRPSDEHLSALEKLESYTERSLHEAFQSGYIQWNDSEKKLTYSGTKDAEKAALNELNEKCLRDFLACYAGTAGLEPGKASDIVNTYLMSLCIAKGPEPGKDGDGTKSGEPTIGWDDRNALFMVLRNVTPKQDGGNASKKQLKAFSLYYAKKDDPKVQKIKAGAQQDVDIELYEDYLCSPSQKVGTVSSGALLYRPHNQLLRMVPNRERGWSRAVFFKNRDACQEYLKWDREPGSQNPPAVSLEEKEEIQKAILGGPLENKDKENSRGKTFDSYGIVATEPATGLANSFDRDILFPIVNHTGDDLRESDDDDSGDNTNGVANIRDKAGNVYGDRLYGVLSVTNQDTIPQSDVEEALSETPKEEPEKKDVNVLQIYFVMDLTGSMTAYKDDILNSLDANFIEPWRNKKEGSQMDVIEFGFIGYKDYPDQNCNNKGETRPRGHRVASFEFPGRGDGATDCAYNYTHQGMVAPEEFRNILRQVKTAGELSAGNAAEQRRVAQDPVPEAMRFGLAKVADPAAWQSAQSGEGRRYVSRYVFVISDAPDHLGEETFSNGIAQPLAQWAKQNNGVIIPIYIRDLRKQSNRKYDETAMKQFGSLGVSGGFVVMNNEDGDYASQFNKTFHGVSDMLIKEAVAQNTDTPEGREEIENNLSDEQTRKKYADDPQTQEQMLQAAAMARHAFGCTMSVWVSKEKKKEFSAFSAIKDPLWVATKDPYSFAGGEVKDGKVAVYSVMTPSVMLSIKDADAYLKKCEEAMKMYKESTSGHNAEQQDLMLIARLAANFLASSVDPRSLLNAKPEELSRIFEQGSGDFNPNKDLPVQSRFALELLKIMGENKGKGSVNVQPLIEAFSNRVEIFKKRLAGAKEFPLEQRVFYTQEAYHKVQSIYQENIDKGAEEIRNIVNTDDINSRSAIVVPYDELP